MTSGHISTIVREAIGASTASVEYSHRAILPSHDHPRSEADCRKRVWELEQRYSEHVTSEEALITELESLRWKLRGLQAETLANVTSAEAEIVRLQDEYSKSQRVCQRLDAHLLEQEEECDTLKAQLSTLQAGVEEESVDASPTAPPEDKMGQITEDVEHKEQEVWQLRTEIEAVRVRVASMHKEALSCRRQLRQGGRQAGLPSNAPVWRHRRELLGYIFSVFAGLLSSDSRERRDMAGVLFGRQQVKQGARLLRQVWSGWTSQVCRLLSLQQHLQAVALQGLALLVWVWHSDASWLRCLATCPQVQQMWGTKPMRTVFSKWHDIVYGKHLQASRHYLLAWRRHTVHRRKLADFAREIGKPRQERQCLDSMRTGLHGWNGFVMSCRSAATLVAASAARHARAAAKVFFSCWKSAVRRRHRDKALARASLAGWQEMRARKRHRRNEIATLAATLMEAAWKAWRRQFLSGQRRRAQVEGLLFARQTLSLCQGPLRNWRRYARGEIRTARENLIAKLKEVQDPGKQALDSMYAVDPQLLETSSEDCRWLTMLDELQSQVRLTAECTTELNEMLSSGRAMDQALKRQAAANQALQLQIEELTKAHKDEIKEADNRVAELERELISHLREQAGVRTKLRHYTELCLLDSRDIAKAELECEMIEASLKESGKVCVELLNDRGQTIAELEATAKRHRTEVVQLQQVLEQQRAQALLQQGKLWRRVKPQSQATVAQAQGAPQPKAPAREAIPAQAACGRTGHLTSVEQEPTSASGDSEPTPHHETTAVPEDIEASSTSWDHPGPLQRVAVAYMRSSHSASAESTLADEPKVHPQEANIPSIHRVGGPGQPW
mmetsp:Transcript_36978/g.85319  ORF Transcript_36978/g.85319 Transcript_36978/m.85319 type:complete len:843 (-) Transcript_36978:151-2679(-)